MDHRVERISEALREELTELIGFELSDPRMGSATVTEVQISPDKRHAFVRIGPAAVAYGSLAVTVNETPQVSQPAPFSRGTTTTVPRTQVTADEKTAKIIELKNAPHVSDIVRNLNAIGATSSDLIAILQALKQSGALHARIKVI